MFSRFTLAFVVAIMVAHTVAAVETVTFQEGVDGYTGTVNYLIMAQGSWQDGASRQYFSVDGKTNESGATDYDKWGLLRFDNIIGSGAGQIPVGATILSAELQLTSYTGTNSQSGGPIGVARMLVPFDSSTRWSSFGVNGPTFGGGAFDRPASGYEGVQRSVADPLELHFGITDIARIVQAWARGEPNDGVMLVCATTDAWDICTTGNTNPATHPKLTVTYTRLRSREIVLQQGVDGYAGTSMLRMTQPTGTTGESTEFGDAVTASGAYVDAMKADGVEPDPDDPDIDALIRFDDVFGEGTTQVSSGATILRAYITLTTPPRSGGVGGTYNAAARGEWELHPMLVDVDWAGDDPSKRFLWSDYLNGDGPTEADNEIGPAAATDEGLAWDSRAWFEVTSLVQGWQNGSVVNRGVIIMPGMSIAAGTGIPYRTSDGWKIYWTSAADPTIRPQLVVVVASGAADLNGDTYVNQDDFGLFNGCVSGPAVPYVGDCAKGDLDGDGDVDSDDFGMFQACYSGTQVAASDCR